MRSSEFYEEQIRNGKTRAAEKLARLEDKHKEEMEKMNRSQEILAQKFD